MWKRNQELGGDDKFPGPIEMFMRQEWVAWAVALGLTLLIGVVCGHP